MIKKYIILVLIIAFFLATRLYKIADNPSSLYWDEASIGYNAYAIATTLHDEWGELLPLHFRAFGEFKLPVYIYSVAMLIPILGLSELAVRLPSVIATLGVVMIIFLITLEITKNKITSLISAFLLTISPWLFIFSRTGYEATIGLMFYILGIYLMLFAAKRKSFIILATVSFAISLYSHLSFRILSPLTFIILILFIINLKNLKQYIWHIGISLLIFIISFIPIIRLMIYDSGFGRLQTLSFIPMIRWVTSSTGKAEFQIIKAPQSSNNSTQDTNFLKNYLSHFSPDFLLGGDKNPRSQQPNFGQLYLPDIFFLMVGLIYIFSKRNKLYLLMAVLFLISPLPASMTVEAPHALRSLAITPFVSFISSLGIIFIAEKLKYCRLIVILILTVYLLLFSNYYYYFITRYPIITSSDWQYGYKQIFTQYNQLFDNYDRIVISNDYGQPYIFALFYLRISPSQFRSTVQYNSPDRWGFSTVKELGNITFQSLKEEGLPKGKLLVFATPQEKISYTKIIDHVFNQDSKLVFNVYEKNN